MGQDQLIRGHIAAAEGRDGCEVAVDGGAAAVKDDVYNDIRGFFLFPSLFASRSFTRLGYKFS